MLSEICIGGVAMTKQEHPDSTCKKRKQRARKEQFQLLDVTNQTIQQDHSDETFTSVDGVFVQGEGWKLENDDEA
jgi:hypothetical protein